MAEYNPRNRNDRAPRDRHSWSEAFSDHTERRRSQCAPVGFQVPKDRPC